MFLSSGYQKPTKMYVFASETFSELVTIQLCQAILAPHYVKRPSGDGVGD
jgi:hypothetical protein